MKRQTVNFPWDLYWKNKTYKLKRYRKIPKISPSKCKLPTLPAQKNLPLNRPSKHRPPGGLYLEIALKYKVQQRKTVE